MEIVDLVLLGISFHGPHEVIHHNYQQNPAGSNDTTLCERQYETPLAQSGVSSCILRLTSGHQNMLRMTRHGEMSS